MGRRIKYSFCWEGMFRGTVQTVEGGRGGQTPIRFRTSNIRNGQNSGLEPALMGISLENLDVGVFQETKFMEGIYTRRLVGYRVVVTPAPSQHQSGIAIFYQESPLFSVKAIHQFGVNFIACQLDTRDRRLYIVVCYMAPSNGMTIQDIEYAIIQKPRDTEFIVVEDLNKDLGKEGIWGREEEITATVAVACLGDLLVQFILR